MAVNRYLAVLGLCTLASAVSAQIVIDDFSTGPYTIVANSGSPVAEAVTSGSMFGGQRDALLTYLAGPQSVTAIVNAGAVQFFNSDSQTSGMLTLQYDGFDGEVADGSLNSGSNLGGNFAGHIGFVFDFRFADPGLASDISLMTTVVSNTGTASNTILIPAGTDMSIFQPFTSFAGVNFGNVQLVEFTFTGSAAADFTLDGIRTAIPGPAAAISFLVALANMRRRRR